MLLNILFNNSSPLEKGKPLPENNFLCRNFGHFHSRKPTKEDIPWTTGILPDNIHCSSCLICGWRDKDPWI